MTREETIKVLAILKAAYPASYKGLSKDEANGIVNLWANVFADDDYNAVQTAVLAHISADTSGFLPPVGAIKNMLVKLTHPEQMTEAEAWALVANAVRRSIYYSGEEFEKLPAICQRIVGSAAQLKEWAVCERTDTMSVAQSNFMRSYRVMVEREREFAALPQAVKAFALEAKEQLLLQE